MTREEFTPIFQELSEAYGERLPLKQATISVWYKVLRDLPADCLEGAALEYMSGPSPYPPTPGQIRSIAMQQAGVTDSKTINTADVDQLMGDFQRLYADYWQTGVYDRISWERLINEFEHTDRVNMAEYVMQKYETVKVDAMERGE